jgi:hypothetical protein
MAAKYVRPVCRSQKNGFNDQQAMPRPSHGPYQIPDVKTLVQLDLSALAAYDRSSTNRTLSSVLQPRRTIHWGHKPHGDGRAERICQAIVSQTGHLLCPTYGTTPPEQFNTVTSTPLAPEIRGPGYSLAWPWCTGKERMAGIVVAGCSFMGLRSANCRRCLCINPSKPRHHPVDLASRLLFE